MRAETPAPNPIQFLMMAALFATVLGLVIVGLWGTEHHSNTEADFCIGFVTALPYANGRPYEDDEQFDEMVSRCIEEEIVKEPRPTLTNLQQEPPDMGGGSMSFFQ